MIMGERDKEKNKMVAIIKGTLIKDSVLFPCIFKKKKGWQRKIDGTIFLRWKIGILQGIHKRPI